MDQLTQQLGMFDDFACDTVTTTEISPHCVLVEISPPRMPKQSALVADKPSKNSKLADKFEAMAETMQVQIDAKMDPNRQTNTAKRVGQAMSARADGERMIRTQQALRALAALHRDGKCPPILASLSSKKAVHELTAAARERVGNGYHDYFRDTGKPRQDASEAGLAVWALLDGKSEAQEKADRILQMERDLQFSKIPGYFPTPKPVIDLMLERAEIDVSHMVLEPSAGSGAILDAIVNEFGGDPASDAAPTIVAYEINPTLCKILQAKGYATPPSDFLESGGMFQFDRVVMNPPFEKQADIDHVTHAFSKLKSGGRLVSVMSPAPFYRDTKKAEAFRAWFSEAGGEVIDLPDNSFKQSGTGVASKLVIIDKE